MRTAYLNRESAVEFLTELDYPREQAATDVEWVSWHVHCAGHTLYLPAGGTVVLRHGPRQDETFELSC
jgi:hypothetical protein